MQRDRNSGILNLEEKFSAVERRSYQEKFLGEVVGHAYAAGTPLKKDLDEKKLTAADIKTVDDLRNLKITKKKDLSDAQKADPPFGGYLTVPMSDLLRIHQSPGPIYDPVGRVADYWRWKTALFSIGFRPGDLVVNTFAYHLTPAGHMFDEGVAETGGVVIPTGVGNTDAQLEILTSLPVLGYIGTPSFLMALLNKAQSLNLKDKIKLEIGFLLAEMLPESMRWKFQTEHGILARQAYGTADVGCIAYECPHTNGMHIHHDVIVEITNPETGAVQPVGDPGEVVVTCNNKIYPLVRFGTGDLSIMTDEQCPCGRTGPLLTRILGRADQVTKVKGMFVHPSQVQRVIDTFPEISKGRLVVSRPGDQDVMTLEIELKAAAEEGLISKIETQLRDIVKIRGSVRVVEPGSLSEEGKTIEDVRKWD